MQRDQLTALEMLVLRNIVGDAQRQLVLLTGAYHGESFNSVEVGMLKQVAEMLEDLRLTVNMLDAGWRLRVAHGQEPNRSDPRGADAAGPARPGDDVPPSTSR